MISVSSLYGVELPQIAAKATHCNNIKSSVNAVAYLMRKKKLQNAGLKLMMKTEEGVRAAFMHPA